MKSSNQKVGKNIKSRKKYKAKRIKIPGDEIAKSDNNDLPYPSLLKKVFIVKMSCPLSSLLC